MYKIVLLRHGESTWNNENRFTGWTDVPLSEAGEKEALFAAKAIKDANLNFERTDQSYIPIINTWRLNERHYGALQGLNKSETTAKHGEEQVKIWRRAYSVAPPALTPDDPRYPVNDPQYASLPKGVLPLTECLEDTVKRVLPFWYDHIAPAILSGKRVFIAAHGNSLRGLVKMLENMTDEKVLSLNIPTGVPLVYELDSELNFIKSYYLMDEKELQKRIDAVSKQGQAK